MNTKSKSKKGIIGITLAAIMIASIFAVITPAPVLADPDPVTLDGQVSPSTEWDDLFLPAVSDAQDVGPGAKTNWQGDNNWASGFDVKGGYVILEDDTLYVRIDAYGMIADTDGNLDPDTAEDGEIRDLPGIAEGGDVSTKEHYYARFYNDAEDCDGNLDYVLRYTFGAVSLTDGVENVIPGAVTDGAFGDIVEMKLEHASDYINTLGNFCVDFEADAQDDGRGEDETGCVCYKYETPEFDFELEYICCRNFEFTGTSSWITSPVVDFKWDYGDGETFPITGYQTGIPEDYNPRHHQYADSYAGSSVWVTLSGHNDMGLDGEHKESVYIPKDPTAVATVTKTLVESGAGEVVTFMCAGSHVDPSAPAGYGLTLSYHWEFDDAGTGDNDDGCDTTRVVDGDDGDIICGKLTVNDTHCEANATVCVRVWEPSECKLRVYGYLDRGAGDYDAHYLGQPLPENPPYTDPMAPFYPQAKQAPRKDFITFDPVYMYHNDVDYPYYATNIKNEDNLGHDASEKIFKRMWYEPTEWYKDENGDGTLDLVMIKGDEMIGWVPAGSDLMYELFAEGYVIKTYNTDDTLGDIYAPSIKQEFTYMMLDASVVPLPDSAPTGGISCMLIPAATRVPNNGIDSFDINGDGIIDVDDKVYIESEYSLSMDIDNDGKGGVCPGNLRERCEPLSKDTAELSGDETLVLTTDELTINLNEELQFFDHKIKLRRVLGTPEDPRANIEIYYQGHASPPGQYVRTVSMAKTEVKFFSSGIENTGHDPQGPFFIEVVDAGKDPDTVTVKIGRMFGETWANIGTNPYWNQKHFYVDGVCYNVVAIKTVDKEELKYITFRMNLPKVPIKIPNHTQHLKGWDVKEILPEMPQYNMPHKIREDVQSGWTIPERIGDKMGDIIPMPPLEIEYNLETTEPRFHGELKEILNESDESWMIEWFQTIPYEYTLFRLPPPVEYMGELHGKYLLTSAFVAPEALNVTWDGVSVPEEPIDARFGQRLKFWYEDCSGPYFMGCEDDEWAKVLRIYGYLDKGAGDPTVDDPELWTGMHPENPPYTDPEAPFYPQADEAPEKDFVTFNPVYMYHNDVDWDNDGIDDDVYATNIKNDFYDASEKIFKRMWYEPAGWYKDEDDDGRLDLALSDGSTIHADELTPEVLWQLLHFGPPIHPSNSELDPGYNDDADIYAPSIKQEFTYMMLDSSVVPQPAAAPTGGGSSMLIPMASWVSDNGIDSFDADGDGMPDRVIIESEYSLSMDIDNDGKGRVCPGNPRDRCEPLSKDTAELSGDETLVLTLDEKVMSKNDVLQFFDHEIMLEMVTGTPEVPRARFLVSSQGTPVQSCTPNIGIGETVYFERGDENTGQAIQGPFFIQVITADRDREVVIVKVGRMFGQTYANVGANPYWNQKQFYVDGVCYDVVAIKTVGTENLKYVMFRQNLPKVPVKIHQHTQTLKGWVKGEPLAEMPQFNMNHTILLDIQKDWTIPEVRADKIGAKMDAPALNITYVCEEEEERFHGELKEIYYEYSRRGEEVETWMSEWYQTIPYQYTGFDLPKGHGLYMVTSAFEAPEAFWALWDGYDDPITMDTYARLKYWFDPDDYTDIYVNKPPKIEEPTIIEWYDRAVNGGNGDGNVCYDTDEAVNAILDYLAYGTGRYPFGPDEIFDETDLRTLISTYLCCSW